MTGCANMAHGNGPRHVTRRAALNSPGKLREQVAEAALYVAGHVDQLLPDSDAVYVLEDGCDVTIHVDRMSIATVEVRTEYVPIERGAE